jgi:poly-beta-1,6-N-acetyl-D-glucosamine synthase
LILKQGYRVIYSPESRSFHPVAGTDEREMERRARMVAGRYQAIFQFWQALPWNYPLVTWQIVSHKYLRPLVPIFMILAFLFNLFALFTDAPDNMLSWLYLGYPHNWLFFWMQIAFYAVALFGRSIKLKGFMGKIFYVPVFLLNSNLAALDGLRRYFKSSQTVMWKRVAR